MASGEERRYVLIVEDEKDLAFLMARILRENHVKPIVRTTGKEALRYFERLERPLDAVILDLRLPDMSGLEVLKEFRILEKNAQKTRIIVVTAFGSPEVRQEALRRGADAFYDKPIELNALVNFVINHQPEGHLAQSNA